MKTTKYNAIQPLYGMELLTFNKKQTAFAFKTAVILITTNIEKTFFGINFLLLFFIWYIMHLLTLSYPLQYAKRL